jgi:hypothetical protein
MHTPFLARNIQVLVNVAQRIDHRGGALGDQQVGTVAQAGIDKVAYAHAVSPLESTRRRRRNWSALRPGELQ